MKESHSFAFQPGNREELLPGFSEDFPYIATRAMLDRYAERLVPWHWHRPAELFYVESGAVEYHTPGGTLLFPAGSGGMVNCNVLHMTRPAADARPNIQLLHIFDPGLLAGGPNSRIARRYISPLAAADQVEMLPLFPEDPVQKETLRLILDAFSIPDGFGYELRLREALTTIWLRLLEQARPLPELCPPSCKSSGQVKQMMAYIHEHYSERITIRQLAAAAFLSERACFRLFQECLHITPAEYLKSYRLQAACRMLAGGQSSVTDIGRACGLGSGSYFGQTFRRSIGCTPSEYRKKWQDHDT